MDTENKKQAFANGKVLSIRDMIEAIRAFTAQTGEPPKTLGLTEKQRQALEKEAEQNGLLQFECALIGSNTFAGIPTHAAPDMDTEIKDKRIAELERQNRDLLLALQGFVDYHTKPAGMTPDVIKDKDRFAAFMEGVEQRGNAVVEQARAVLAGGQAIRPTDDKLWEQTLRDRDLYREWADKLADAIAKHFGAEIGEHSNMNCPWYEALEVIESADTPAAATTVDMPTLPKSLLNLIGEYGMARTDGVGELEIQHRWLSLIAGIKDYARATHTPTASSTGDQKGVDA